MGNVPVPHFGVHLKKEVFNQIKSNLEKKLNILINHILDSKERNLSKIHFL